MTQADETAHAALMGDVIPSDPPPVRGGKVVLGLTSEEMDRLHAISEERDMTYAAVLLQAFHEFCESWKIE